MIDMTIYITGWITWVFVTFHLGRLVTYGVLWAYSDCRLYVKNGLKKRHVPKIFFKAFLGTIWRRLLTGAIRTG